MTGEAEEQLVGAKERASDSSRSAAAPRRVSRMYSLVVRTSSAIHGSTCPTARSVARWYRLTVDDALLRPAVSEALPGPAVEVVGLGHVDVGLRWRGRVGGREGCVGLCEESRS